MIYDIKTVKLPNGETMAYREAGTKRKEPVLLLIHGNQSSSVIFETTMRRMESDAHIYAVDLPGFGESSYEKQHETLKEWADDVAQFMNKKKIASATVLGWSAGGGVAMELAACYPDKVEQMVLVSSVGVKGLKMPPKKLGGFPSLRSSTVQIGREAVAKDSHIAAVCKAIEEQNAPYFRFLWDESVFNVEDPPDPEFDAYVQEILKERCFLDMSVALSEFNITHEFFLTEGTGRISDIKCPIAWVHGKLDIVVPMDIAVESVKYFESPIELIPIYDAGHASFIDQPEIFEEILCGII